MTHTDLINASTGCIRANADVARRIMTGQQTQHRVLAKGKNNPFRVGEIYWIREPGRVASIRYLEGIIPYVVIQYAARREDFSPIIDLPCRFTEKTCKEPNWVTKRQGIPNGIFKEAARTFIKINRAWREPVQSISERDALAEGIIHINREPMFAHWGVEKSGRPIVLSEWDNNTPEAAFKNLFDSIYPGAWDRNEDVWACEFELVKVTE